MEASPCVKYIIPTIICYRTDVLTNTAPVATRRCGRCGETRAIDEFNRSSRFGRQYYCRRCQSSWYRDNRVDHVANVTANTRRYRRRNTVIVREYLQSHPCVDCGESDPDVLEFDHVRGKQALVSRLRWVGVAAERLLGEIDKCEVRCVNCHRRRTASQFGWRKAQEAREAVVL